MTVSLTAKDFRLYINLGASYVMDSCQQIWLQWWLSFAQCKQKHSMHDLLPNFHRRSKSRRLKDAILFLIGSFSKIPFAKMILTSEVEVLQTPLKSPSDRKKYKHVRLPNGLKAVLVQSTCSETENVSGETAVCLCIDVGSFDDPKSVQGLSHFLEHMVCYVIPCGS